MYLIRGGLFTNPAIDEIFACVTARIFCVQYQVTVSGEESSEKFQLAIYNGIYNDENSPMLSFGPFGDGIVFDTPYLSSFSTRKILRNFREYSRKFQKVVVDRERPYLQGRRCFLLLSRLAYRKSTRQEDVPLPLAQELAPKRVALHS